MFFNKSPVILVSTVGPDIHVRTLRYMNLHAKKGYSQVSLKAAKYLLFFELFFELLMHPQTIQIAEEQAYSSQSESSEMMKILINISIKKQLMEMIL